MLSPGRVGCVALLLLLLPVCDSTWAAIAGLERLATGLNYPVYATHAPGDNERLFVLEKGGVIKIIDLDGGGVLGDFLTIPDTDSAGEGGLVGMAFHPDYNNSGTPGHGKFYVYVTVDNGGVPIDGQISPYSSHIREYSVSANPDVANPTATEIISWVQPRDNHNGGWIGFNPQTSPEQPQYLYINSGDGGKQGDPDNNAQTIVNEKLGKVLRIDVDGDDFSGDPNLNYSIPPGNPFAGPATGDDEIWAYGLRNPWRASFDRDNGDLWVGDVGFSAREEIDHLPAGAPPDANLGWRLWEGTVEYAASPGVYPPGYVGPVYDYGHGNSPMTGNSVVGGYVYRGPDPELFGIYVFGDSWNGGNVWTFDPANPSGTVENIEGQLTPDVGSMTFPVSFAEDAVGNLYVVDYSNSSWGPNLGEIYRIVTDALLAGDYDADGDVDEDDYDVWKDSFGSTVNLAADGNGNSIVDAADYTVWRNNLGATVHTAGAGSGTRDVSGVPEPATVVMLGQLVALLTLASWRRRS